MILVSPFLATIRISFNDPRVNRFGVDEIFDATIRITNLNGDIS